MVSWVGAANSPCGNSDRSLSFYCPSNHMIYMDVADDVAYWKRNPHFTRALATHTVAHEYGHGLQQMTGILPAFYRFRYAAPTEAARLLVNRRMELQASCLGNVFLGANRNSYPIRASCTGSGCGSSPRAAMCRPCRATMAASRAMPSGAAARSPVAASASATPSRPVRAR